MSEGDEKRQIEYDKTEAPYLSTCALHCLTSETDTAASTRPPLTLSSLFKSEKRKWREIARVGGEGKDGEGDIVKPMRGSLAAGNTF